MNQRPLRVVMTAGGTKERIDDVRHISNVATGSLPAAIGEALLERGCHVHYIHGPGARVPGELITAIDLLQQPTALLSQLVTDATARARALQRGKLTTYPIESAANAAATLVDVVRQTRPDAALCAMAVADYAPEPTAGKISSQLDELVIRLRPTAKTIDLVKATDDAVYLVGFKLLSAATWPQRAAACRTLAQRSGASLVFCNDMQDYRAGIRRGWLYDAEGRRLKALGDAHTDTATLALNIALEVLHHSTVRPRSPAP